LAERILVIMCDAIVGILRADRCDRGELRFARMLSQPWYPCSRQLEESISANGCQCLAQSGRDAEHAPEHLALLSGHLRGI
jgi:hypothetical protein